MTAVPPRERITQPQQTTLNKRARGQHAYLLTASDAGAQARAAVPAVPVSAQGGAFLISRRVGGQRLPSMREGGGKWKMENKGGPGGPSLHDGPRMREPISRAVID